MLDRLYNGIPLAEASAFFIGLKSFEKTADENNVGSSQYGPPDETGALEGQFAAPVEQVLAQMAKMVQNELKTQFAYMVYANSLRDFSHGSIAEEFEDHAGNETEHADFLLRRMSVIGGPVHIPDIPSPPAATDPHEIINTMIRMEQEGIKNWRVLRELVGDDNPMRFKIEEYLTREQEHLDELWQLLPHQSNPAVLMQQPVKTAGSVYRQLGKVASGGFPGFFGGVLGAKGDDSLGGALSGVSAGRAVDKLLSPHIGVASLPTAFLAGVVAGRGYSKLKDLALSRAKDEGVESRPIIQISAVSGKDAKSKKSRTSKTASENSEVYKDIARKFPHLAAKSSVPSVKGNGSVGKEKGSQMDLPLTAQGMQPTPPTPPPLSGPAAGNVMTPKISSVLRKIAKEDSEQVESGRSRAIANLSSGFTSSKASRGEDLGSLLGRLGGAAGGAYLGDKAAKNVGASPSARLAGILGGAALGQSVGGSAGKSVGHEVDRARFHKKHASMMFKRALEELGSIGASPEADEGPSPMDPETLSYLQQEEAGRAAEEAAESAFYRQKFQEASQKLQGLQQQAQQLQSQVDQQNEMQQQVLAQAKQIQDSSLQNSMAAHQAATLATQQALQAQQKEIRQAQLSVGMRDAVHAMRSSLLQAVQQNLPPATPGEMAPGQDNSMQPDSDSMGTGPGQPASAENPGTPMQSPTPGDGSGAGVNPSAGAGAAPTMSGATPQGQVGIQEGQPKVGSAHDKIVGALVGGALGAGGTYLESRMSNDPLRDKIKRLEAIRDAGAGFANSMNLAQAKARLALGEFTSNHPVAASVIGGALGASTGVSTAPYARQIIGG